METEAKQVVLELFVIHKVDEVDNIKKIDDKIDIYMKIVLTELDTMIAK